MTNIRELILMILMEVTENQKYSNVVIKQVLDKYRFLSKKDRSFIKRVCDGTMERRIEIDYLLNCFSKTPVEKMEPVVANILRTAVYQILYMTSVPDSAACNEAVELTKKYTEKAARKRLAGFVNGVLRNFIRKKEHLKYPGEEEDHYLSVTYSVPQWMADLFVSAYGREQAELIFEDFLSEKLTCIRCNTARVSVEKLTEMLEKEHVNVMKGPYLKECLFLSGYNMLSKLEAFKKGYFYIQDVSSMLVAELSGVKEKDIVLDVCAAPGGKSLHFAELLNGSGEVYAMDVSEAKTALIEQNMTRCGLKNIKTTVADGRIFQEKYENMADILLADVPCSGLGIIGKKADIKYRITPEKMKDLVSLQRKIVANVIRYVKPGGTFLYSTCTLNPAENMGNVQWMMENLDVETVSLDEFLPSSLRSETTKQGCLTLLPGIHKSDGFFVAKFIKKS